MEFSWKSFEKRANRTRFCSDVIKSVSSYCLYSIILSASSVQSFIICSTVFLIMREESESTKYIKDFICAVELKQATFFNYDCSSGQNHKSVEKKEESVHFWTKKRNETKNYDESAQQSKQLPVMHNKKHSNATNDIWRKTIYNNFLSLFLSESKGKTVHSLYCSSVVVFFVIFVFGTCCFEWSCYRILVAETE